MIVRAYDENDARIQEEVLKKSASLAKKLDVQVKYALSLCVFIYISIHINTYGFMCPYMYEKI